MTPERRAEIARQTGGETMGEVGDLQLQTKPASKGETCVTGLDLHDLQF
jgi:hypothetical protein